MGIQRLFQIDRRFILIGIVIALMIVLVYCVIILMINYNHEPKYANGHGYGMITDSTFYFFIHYSDGSSDSTFYKCKPDEINLAMKKIMFDHIYPSLNDAAKKEYHEKLFEIETVQFLHK